LPGHVFCALLGELPLHLANLLIRPTGLSLQPLPVDDEASALMAAAAQLPHAPWVPPRSGPRRSKTPR
jgi:hypothetical protein